MGIAMNKKILLINTSIKEISKDYGNKNHG